jgi:hypothetical protein
MVKGKRHVERIPKDWAEAFDDTPFIGWAVDGTSVGRCPSV